MEVSRLTSSYKTPLMYVIVFNVLFILLLGSNQHKVKRMGYEAKFVNTLLKRHECPICLFAMRNPVQTECGHLFCKDCLEPVLKRRQPICPLDKEDITPGGVRILM